MLFNPVKEINRLKKEIVYWQKECEILKSYEKNWLSQNFDFLSLTSLLPGEFLGEFQLTQISSNFQTSCCNLKLGGLGVKLCVAFLLFWFWKELLRFRAKESKCILLNKNINFNKNENQKSKMQNPTDNFREANLVLQLI